MSSIGSHVSSRREGRSPAPLTLYWQAQLELACRCQLAPTVRIGGSIRRTSSKPQNVSHTAMRQYEGSALAC